MFKNLKKKVMLAALVVLALGNTLSVAAAASINSANYKDAYVTKFTDYTTGTLRKTALGDATNDVTSIPAGISLCSWVNNHYGERVTNKVDYSSTGKYYMTFNKTPVVETPGKHLDTTMTISTQLLELSSSYSSGTWSPDTF